MSDENNADKIKTALVVSNMLTATLLHLDVKKIGQPEAFTQSLDELLRFLRNAEETAMLVEASNVKKVSSKKETKKKRP